MSLERTACHVILCSHDGVRHIEAQVRSILDQSRAVDCVHVFDHASTDGTRAVLDRLAQEDARVRWHPHADAPGAAASFFRAFRALAGTVGPQDCIFLSDQDDVWLPHKVAAMHEAFAREWPKAADPRLALFHDVAVVDDRLQVLRPSFYDGRKYALPRDLHPRRMLTTNPVIGHTLVLSGALLRDMAELPAQQDYVMHDWATALVARRLDRLAFVPQVLSLYRQHAANVVGAGIDRPWRGRIARGHRLAHLVLRQARAYARNFPPAAVAGDRMPANTVARAALRSQGALALALGWQIVRYGATWRHKALAAFLLLESVLPFDAERLP